MRPIEAHQDQQLRRLIEEIIGRLFLQGSVD